MTRAMKSLDKMTRLIWLAAREAETTILLFNASMYHWHVYIFENEISPIKIDCGKIKQKCNRERTRVSKKNNQSREKK